MEKINHFGPALVILAAAILFVGGLVWFSLRTAPATAGQSTQLPGVTASNIPKGPVPGVPQYHTAVSGLVASVGNGSITVGVQQDNGPSASVVVAVNSGTEIYKQGPLKSQTEFQQEAAAFRQKLQNSDPSIVYVGPDKYTHIPLSLSDIHINDYVYIVPTADPVSGQTITAASIDVASANQQ